MGKELPDDISRPSKIDPVKPIQGEEQQQEPAKPFSSFMGEGPKVGETTGAKVTPFDLAQGQVVQRAGPSNETVVGQMNSTSSVLGDIQNQLHTKNLKLKQSQKYLLRNKLTEANSLIRTAAEKTGAEVGPPVATVSRQSPIGKFLSYITDSQAQLDNARGMIAKLSKGGQHLSPGKLLLVQVKLAKAQQELEYTSVLLGKAVDDIKMLFNIQI